MNEDSPERRKLLVEVGVNNDAYFTWDGGENAPQGVIKVTCNNHDSLVAALKTSLQKHGLPTPDAVGIAVASPIEKGNRATMAGHKWSPFSGDEIRDKLGIPKKQGHPGEVRLVRRLEAITRALPGLASERTLNIGRCGRDRADGRPRVLLMPGADDFGMYVLFQGDGGQVFPFGTWGGEATLGTSNVIEAMFVDRLSQTPHGERVPAKDVLTENGLIRVLQGVYREKQQPQSMPTRITPLEIVSKALAGDDDCRDAVKQYLGFFGTFAGDCGVMLGASGVYIVSDLVSVMAGTLTTDDLDALRVRDDLVEKEEDEPGDEPVHRFEQGEPHRASLVGLSTFDIAADRPSRPAMALVRQSGDFRPALEGLRVLMAG